MNDDISDLKQLAKNTAMVANLKAKTKKPNASIQEKLDYMIAMLEQ